MKATTAVTCSPLIDSKCAIPLSRIACASASLICPWSPVTKAAPIAPLSAGMLRPDMLGQALVRVSSRATKISECRAIGCVQSVTGPMRRTPLLRIPETMPDAQNHNPLARPVRPAASSLARKFTTAPGLETFDHIACGTQVDANSLRQILMAIGCHSQSHDITRRKHFHLLDPPVKFANPDLRQTPVPPPATISACLSPGIRLIWLQRHQRAERTKAGIEILVPMQILPTQRAKKSDQPGTTRSRQRPATTRCPLPPQPVSIAPADPFRYPAIARHSSN